MKKHTFEEVEALIDQHPEIEFQSPRSVCVGASEDTIQQAEAILGIGFPEDYRKFLSKWGCLTMFAYGCDDIYGIINNDVHIIKYPSTIYMTLFARKPEGPEKCYPELPEYYIVVYCDEGDAYYCIDTRDPDGPVISWNCFDHCIEFNLADSFVDFLYKMVAESIEYLESESGT
ncbi:MAG: SMI1/KNR4 family protein [Planctomycetia bacterium]|nr:SMI1/KNR4 family protein [Planctomycetia bacterium]